MSEIDWTKAPEWATHYGPENDCYCEAWYRVVDGKIVTFAEADSANCVPQPANQGECFYHPIENLIAPWAGEGLPPVGTEVEIRELCWSIRESAREFIGKPVRVAAVFEMESGTSMIAVDGGLDLGCEVFRTEMAFPIRTPEQIAADEHLHNVRNACSDIADTLDDLRGKTKMERAALAVVEAMIAAGYRKVTP